MIEELKESVQEEGLASIMPQGGNAMTSIENATNPGMPVANIVEQQETARNLSESQLIELAKSPDPALIPPYLVTGELMRRKSIREKQAKAPQFTVAEEVVQQAEQGIMGQMQQMAPNMPPGGAVPMREEVTREQIMAKGLPQLPNPGPARPTMTGFAEGGIIGFAPGGYTGQGAYMPPVKGKNAFANLNFAAPPVGSRTRAGLYQDYNLNQGPGMSMEDYKAQEAAILGPDRDKRISTLQEQFVTPFDEQINLVESQITELGYGQKDPVTGLEIPGSFMLATPRPEDIFKIQELQNQKALLEQQRGLYFEDMSDPQVKARRVELANAAPDVSVVEQQKALVEDKEPIFVGAKKDLGAVGDLEKKKANVQSRLDDIMKRNSELLKPIDPNKEAADAMSYFDTLKGDSKYEDKLIENMEERKRIGKEELNELQKDKITGMYLNAAKAFMETGPYGTQLTNALIKAGESGMAAKKGIKATEKELNKEIRMLDTQLLKLDKEEQRARQNFGANSYQTSQAYNRKLPLMGIKSELEALKISTSSDQSLALNRLMYTQRNQDRNYDFKVKKELQDIENKVRAGKSGGIDSTTATYAMMDPNKVTGEKIKEIIIEAKQKVEAAVQQEKNKLLGVASPSTSTSAPTLTYDPSTKKFVMPNQ